MIGDRSLLPATSGLNLPVHVRGTLDRPHAGAPPGVRPAGVAERALPNPAGTAEGQEAARLRSLLSDPAVRVSMHEDASSGHLVMQVEDRATGEMVEQIPSERLLRLYQSLRESLVDEQV